MRVLGEAVDPVSFYCSSVNHWCNLIAQADQTRLRIWSRQATPIRPFNQKEAATMFLSHQRGLFFASLVLCTFAEQQKFLTRRKEVFNNAWFLIWLDFGCLGQRFLVFYCAHWITTVTSQICKFPKWRSINFEQWHQATHFFLSNWNSVFYTFYFDLAITFHLSILWHRTWVNDFSKMSMALCCYFR